MRARGAHGGAVTVVRRVPAVHASRAPSADALRASKRSYDFVRPGGGERAVFELRPGGGERAVFDLRPGGGERDDAVPRRGGPSLPAAARPPGGGCFGGGMLVVYLKPLLIN